MCRRAFARCSSAARSSVVRVSAEPRGGAQTRAGARAAEGRATPVLARGTAVRSTRFLASALLAHLAAAGCYRPTLRDCTVACSAEADCAGDQHCADGWCVGAGIESCDFAGVLPDGSMVTNGDASASGDAFVAPDARDICEQGCSNGTCIGGVCTIDCSAAGSCPNDVLCPANLPCHVICGDSACGHKVNCSMALDCTVDCIGNLACHDEIICSTHACTVTCSGTDSCDRRTKCASSCSCDITCSGASSCREVSECPEAICRVGNACTSQPVGCDTCP
jgi:hypothetical protein